MPEVLLKLLIVQSSPKIYTSVYSSKIKTNIVSKWLKVVLLTKLCENSWDFNKLCELLTISCDFDKSLEQPKGSLDLKSYAVLERYTHYSFAYKNCSDFHHTKFENWCYYDNFIKNNFICIHQSFLLDWYTTFHYFL